MSRQPFINDAIHTSLRRADDVIYGRVNHAGEHNRNVARMASLQAGLPAELPGANSNRRCGVDRLGAIGTGAQSIRCGVDRLAQDCIAQISEDPRLVQ